MADRVTKAAGDAAKQFFAQQGARIDAVWMPPRFEDNMVDELRVGGVYVNKFMDDPNFPLRNPKRFMEGLLEEIVKGENSDIVALLGTALVMLLRTQVGTCDNVAQLGYIPRLVKQWNIAEPNGSTCHTMALVLHTCSNNRACVERLSTNNQTITGIHNTCSQSTNMESTTLALCTLKNMCDKKKNRAMDSVVHHVIQNQLIKFLLQKLDYRKQGQTDLGVAKVHAIDALKRMAEPGSSVHAERVRQMLDASPVWHAYRDQNHDLYLPSSDSGAVAGMLESSADTLLALEGARSKARSFNKG